MSLDTRPARSDREIYLSALDIADEQPRLAYLQQACGGDAEQLREIQRLLAAHHDRAANPVDLAIKQLGPAETCGLEPPGSLDFDISSQPVIDRYKLLEQIGQGGMGAVFMAQQNEPIRRRVALKLIKAGMDSREVISRFQAERQALAMMDHPNIARVLDAGTTDQRRPYFVMELVRGVPITDYCDSNRLSIDERLRLFVDVCRAVQHAHLKGIIHRDLKPSNVMVTLHDGVPVVKVIDFGIAKALNQELSEGTQFTQFSQMIGTPLYMSPEQAEMSGLDIDTRSDVYSLGVLLYELLTGSTPFDKETFSKAGFDGMRRIIREQEPLRPSHQVSTLEAHLLSTISSRRTVDPRQLSLSLKRELDWIAMKALEKDRNRRYESASAMAQEIQRYLGGELVEACPPSIVYRTKKLARRNRTLVLTSVAIGISLLFGMGISLWQAARAEAAAQVAEQERDKAERHLQASMDAVERLLTSVGSPKLASVPKLQQTWVGILGETVEFYERFKADSGSSPDVDYRAAKVFLRFAQLLQSTQPDSQEVIKSGLRGLELADTIVLKEPKRNDYRKLQADLNFECAEYYWMPRSLANEELDVRAIMHFQRAQEQYAYLALVDPDGGDYYKKSQGRMFAKLAELHATRSPSDPRVKELIHRGMELGWYDYSLLARFAETDDPKIAAKYWRQAIADYRSVPDRLDETTKLWWASSAGEGLAKFDPELAEWIWQEGIKTHYDSLQDFPSNKRMRNLFDMSCKSYSRFLLKAERRSQALDETDALVESSPAFHTLRAMVLNDWDGADGQLELLDDSIRRFPNQPEYYRVRADVREKRGQLDDALSDLNHTLELDEHHRHVLKIRGGIHYQLKNYQQAVDDYTKELTLHGGVDNYFAKRRAAAYFGQGEYAEALADLNRAIDQRPGDLSALAWIAAAKIAACPDRQFRAGILKLADRAVELNAGSPDGLLYRAVLLTALGQPGRAIADFENAIELAPAGADVYNNVAWQLVTCTDASSHWNPPRAVELATKAVELSPEDGMYLNTLGVSHYRDGDYSAALKYLAKAVELDRKGEGVAHNGFFLAMSHEQLGDHEEAGRWYNKAVQWMGEHESTDVELVRFKREAEQLLGLE